MVSLPLLKRVISGPFPTSFCRTIRDVYISGNFKQVFEPWSQMLAEFLCNVVNLQIDVAALPRVLNSTL